MLWLSTFTTHTLDSKKGGAVHKIHNEVRDEVADLLASTYSQVQKEVIISDTTHKTLVADIKARGVWQTQTDTLFDISVINTDAPSHLSTDPYKVLVQHAHDKKTKKRVSTREAHSPH
eukprot:GHVR01044594.1.p1 GENE.GHVR01044594.1~~GHVR01044594.1.p1  ORF type:complete len:118 (+),score=19.17 GHVR01044594.1:2187-2540(+)